MLNSSYSSNNKPLFPKTLRNKKQDFSYFGENYAIFEIFDRAIFEAIEAEFWDFDLEKKNPGQKRLLLTSGMYGSLCRTNSYGNMNYPSTPTPQVLRPSFGLDVSYDLKSLELKTLTRKYGTYYWIYILHIIMKTQILNDNQIIKNQSYLVRCLPLFLQHKLYWDSHSYWHFCFQNRNEFF